MATISFIVLVLLALVGYSIGAVSKAGKSADLKPQLIDLALVLIIWAAAIYSRATFDLNRWLLILLWLILSAIVGVLAVWPRKLLEVKISATRAPKEAPGNIFQEIWQSWGDLSSRMGNFQTRILLSLFFFILVLPFALAVKAFSDPLSIKQPGRQSHWLPRIQTHVDLEQFRRQF